MYEFDIEIDSLDYPIEAWISYQVVKEYKEGRYREEQGYEVVVLDTVYTSFGAPLNVEGKIWDKLERICQEKAEDHFFTTSEVA